MEKFKKFKSKEIKKHAQKQVKGAGVWTPGGTSVEPGTDGLWPGIGQEETNGMWPGIGQEETNGMWPGTGQSENGTQGAWTPGV